MSTTPAQAPSRIPINPYWVGGSFLDYRVSKGWMIKEREGRSLHYFATPEGVDGLEQFGIQIQQPRLPAKPAKRSK